MVVQNYARTLIGERALAAQRGEQGDGWLPTDAQRLEVDAAAALTGQGRAHLFSVAGTGATARANREAFARWQIVPRVMRDVSQRDLRIELLGRELPAPLLMAPIGVQSVLHPEGELASARAAARFGVRMSMVLGDVSGFFIRSSAVATASTT